MVARATGAVVTDMAGAIGKAVPVTAAAIRVTLADMVAVITRMAAAPRTAEVTVTKTERGACGTIAACLA